jgi:hypothetical protein
MRTLADPDSEAVPDSAFPFTRRLACAAIALLCACTSAQPTSAASQVAAPPDALYVCVTEGRDGTRRTAIEFAPNVEALCRRHPEMGPCQYERNVCRKRGGRVFAAGGAEITMATEAEYDRKVMRVRMRSR